MGHKNTEIKAINERLLRSWIRCRRKAWLDCYGDKSKKVWSAHQTLQLDHQKLSFSAFIKGEAGVGLKGCEEGRKNVFGLKVTENTYFNNINQSQIVLINKINGQSIWGDFAYQPVICRQGKNLTKEHKLTLAMSGVLLQKIQRFPVNKALIVSKNRKKLEINTLSLNEEIYKELFSNISKMQEELLEDNPLPLTTNRKKCSICTWRRLCDKEATSKGHLSEISGVGRKRIEMLKKIGINNIKDLSLSNSIYLENKFKIFGNQHKVIANKLINQSYAIYSGEKLKLTKNESLPEIINAPGLIIYDIESDPDIGLDFLHGFIHIKRDAKGLLDISKSEYTSLIVSNNKREDLTWERLKKVLEKNSDWPILHYGETEFLSMSRIAKRQGESEEYIATMKKRFIDIHSRVKTKWCLPINSYGLKTMANWIGFKWSGTYVDGSKALLWWRQLRQSSKSDSYHSKNLDRILTYNKEDCIATWEVANWLINNDI